MLDSGSVLPTLFQNLRNAYNIDCVKLYSMDSSTISAAITAGLKVVGTIYLDSNSDDNYSAVTNAINTANSFRAGSIIAITCGNELANTMAYTQAAWIVQNCVNWIKQGTTSAGTLKDSNIKIGTHEIINVFVESGSGNSDCSFVASGYSAITNIDYFGADIYPFWINYFAYYYGNYNINACVAGFNVSSWINNLFNVYSNIQGCVAAQLPNVPVIITETSWPGSNATNAELPNPVVTNGCIVEPSSNGGQLGGCYFCNDYYCTDNYKQRFITGIMARARTDYVPLILFEAYDEPWKRFDAYFWEADWGMCSSFSPYTCVFTV